MLRPENAPNARLQIEAVSSLRWFNIEWILASIASNSVVSAEDWIKPGVAMHFPHSAQVSKAPDHFSIAATIPAIEPMPQRM